MVKMSIKSFCTVASLVPFTLHVCLFTLSPNFFTFRNEFDMLKKITRRPVWLEHWEQKRGEAEMELERKVGAKAHRALEKIRFYVGEIERHWRIFYLMEFEFKHSPCCCK